MSQKNLNLILLEEASNFIQSLDEKVKEKITYNLRKVRSGVKDDNLFSKLDGTEIWEFRTLYVKTCYRLFAFWDPKQKSLVVATHGIVKKTNKTPKKEIAKAEKIRKEYLEE